MSARPAEHIAPFEGAAKMFAKSLMIVSVASMCALSMGYLNNMLTASRCDTITVIVARADLPRWTQVGQPEVLFETRKLSLTQAPARFIPLARLEDVKNRPLVRPLAQGQVLTWDDLLDRNHTALDVKLSPGKRAFAIPTSADSLAALALPGARVDVLQVRSSEGQLEVNYVAENTVVIAPARTTETGVAITVEVSPEEVMDLTRALAEGNLTVTLRPFGEQPGSGKARHSRPGSGTNRVTSPPLPPEAELPDSQLARR
ncbi:MAG: Flp pilus assembly protein CpaB [Gemmataceae bacterium]